MQWYLLWYLLCSGMARGGPGAAAVGAPPQRPGRLRRKNIAGGSAPRHPPERGLGRSTSGGLGIEPPATRLQPSRPVIGGGAPTPCVHDSIKPTGLVRREESSLQICLNPVWRVGCEGSRNEPERSEGNRSEAEDRSPPSRLAHDPKTKRCAEMVIQINFDPRGGPNRL
ncbi:MAG: hypothetical protein GY696_31205, partial [Gammaproteobacteria bacterium]|nr:hypothetical protein [Gammaproteobacteria bacterium]